MLIADCYKILEIFESETLTLAVLQKHYKKLVLKYHPDHWPDELKKLLSRVQEGKALSSEEQGQFDKANQNFYNIVQAYRQLRESLGSNNEVATILQEPAARPSAKITVEDKVHIHESLFEQELLSYDINNDHARKLYEVLKKRGFNSVLASLERQGSPYKMAVTLAYLNIDIETIDWGGEKNLDGYKIQTTDGGVHKIEILLDIITDKAQIADYVASILKDKVGKPFAVEEYKAVHQPERLPYALITFATPKEITQAVGHDIGATQRDDGKTIIYPVIIENIYTNDLTLIRRAVEKFDLEKKKTVMQALKVLCCYFPNFPWCVIAESQNYVIRAQRLGYQKQRQLNYQADSHVVEMKIDTTNTKCAATLMFEAKVIDQFNEDNKGTGKVIVELSDYSTIQSLAQVLSDDEQSRPLQTFFYHEVIVVSKAEKDYFTITFPDVETCQHFKRVFESQRFVGGRHQGRGVICSYQMDPASIHLTAHFGEGGKLNVDFPSEELRSNFLKLLLEKKITVNPAAFYGERAAAVNGRKVDYHLDLLIYPQSDVNEFSIGFSQLAKDKILSVPTPEKFDLPNRKTKLKPKPIQSPESEKSLVVTAPGKHN